MNIYKYGCSLTVLYNSFEKNECNTKYSMFFCGRHTFQPECFERFSGISETKYTYVTIFNYLGCINYTTEII